MVLLHSTRIYLPGPALGPARSLRASPTPSVEAAAAVLTSTRARFFLPLQRARGSPRLYWVTEPQWKRLGLMKS